MVQGVLASKGASMSTKTTLEKKVAALIKKLNITDVDLATSVPLLLKQLEKLETAEKAQADADTEQVEADTEQAEAKEAQAVADTAKAEVKAKPAPKAPTKKGHYVAESACITGKKGKLFKEGQAVQADQLAGGQEALDHLVKRKKVIHVK